MYCSKCKFTTFDHLEQCPKCNLDWEDARKFFNFTWIEPGEATWSFRSSGEGGVSGGFDMDADVTGPDDDFMQEVDLDDNEVFTTPASEEEEVFEVTDDSSEDMDLFAVEEEPSAVGKSKTSQTEIYGDDETIEVEATTDDTDGFSIPELDAMFGPDEESASLEDTPAATSRSDDVMTLAQDLDLEEIEDMEEVPNSRGGKKAAAPESEDEFDADSLLDSIELDLDEDDSSS